MKVWRTEHWYRLGIGAALCLASALASQTSAAKKNDTIRFATAQTLDNFDPYFNNLVLGILVADNVWDTLIFHDPETGEYKEELASAWRWIDDKTLELDLRQGVRFHNGAEFDADDVVYTLNFVSKPENKARQDVVHWIDHVEKLAKYKVRIVTREPCPAAIAYLAYTKFVIHPHEYYARVGPKGVNERPIGSGPFRVLEYARGKYIRIERNPDYFRDSPKSQPRIDKVEIRFIPDAQTRVAEMVAGGLDLVSDVARDQAEQLRTVPSLEVVSGGSNRYAYLQMNTLARTPAPQLRDVRVRQAIMYAIDRETMTRFLVGNGSRVLHADCLPSQFGCPDDVVPRYEYDPGKARRLLAEAGFAGGFDIDIYAYLDRNQTEAVIGYLSAVGIRAHMRFMQTAAVLSAVRAEKAALAQAAVSVVDDVGTSASRLHEFTLDDVNRDPEIRDLLVRGDSSMDPDVRKEAYTRAFALIAGRAYVLPLYSLPTYYLASKDLVFKPYDDGTPRLWEMYYK